MSAAAAASAAGGDLAEWTLQMAGQTAGRVYNVCDFAGCGLPPYGDAFELPAKAFHLAGSDDEEDVEEDPEEEARIKEERKRRTAVPSYMTRRGIESDKWCIEDNNSNMAYRSENRLASPEALAFIASAKKLES